MELLNRERKRDQYTKCQGNFCVMHVVDPVKSCWSEEPAENSEIEKMDFLEQLSLGKIHQCLFNRIRTALIIELNLKGGKFTLMRQSNKSRRV